MMIVESMTVRSLGDHDESLVAEWKQQTETGDFVLCNLFCICSADVLELWRYLIWSRIVNSNGTNTNTKKHNMASLNFLTHNLSQ